MKGNQVMDAPNMRRRQGERGRRFASGKLAASAAVIGVAGILASTATYSAWSVTDSNTGNQIGTATICLEDSQGGISSGYGTGSNTALINISNATPSTFPWYDCIAVDYHDTAASPSTTMDIYTSGDPGGDTVGPNLNIEIQRGTTTSYTTFSTSTKVNNCQSTFTSTTTVFSSGVLSTFLANHTSDATSVNDTSWASAANINSGTFQVYLISITAGAGLGPNQTTNGTFGLTFQADQS